MFSTRTWMLTCFSARRSARLLPSRNKNELREKKRVRQVEKGLKMAEAHLKNCQSFDCQTLGVLQISLIWYNFFIHIQTAQWMKKRFSFVWEYFDTIRYYIDTSIHTFLSCILWSHFIIFSTFFACAAEEQRLSRNPPDLNLQTIIYIYTYILFQYHYNILTFTESLF